MSTTPQIAGQFTDWKYKHMRPVIKFVKDNDEDPPDFLQELIDEGLIRRECSPDSSYKENLNENEEKHMRKRLDRYYEDNWPSLILLQMKYKEPCIANLEYLTEYLNHPDSIDPNKVMYFHVAYVPPGRNYYIVKHDSDTIIEDEEVEEGKADVKLKKFFTSIHPNKGRKPKEFYVHELIAGFRHEDVP